MLEINGMYGNLPSSVKTVKYIIVASITVDNNEKPNNIGNPIK